MLKKFFAVEVLVFCLCFVVCLDFCLGFGFCSAVSSVAFYVVMRGVQCWHA